jgi:hypothetical protein
MSNPDSTTQPAAPTGRFSRYLLPDDDADMVEWATLMDRAPEASIEHVRRFVRLTRKLEDLGADTPAVQRKIDFHLKKIEAAKGQRAIDRAKERLLDYMEVTALATQESPC